MEEEEEEEKARDRSCISRGIRGGRYRYCICTRYYAAPYHAEGALGWSPHLEVCGRRRRRAEAVTSGSSASGIRPRAKDLEDRGDRIGANLVYLPSFPDARFPTTMVGLAVANNLVADNRVQSLGAG